jgi:hypothetical protein
MRYVTMHLDDFEEDFLPQILFRGLDYYRRALVQELSRSGNRWTARVTGSQRYTVEVVLSQKREITNISCNCPYDWDPFCKHEAAVLFELRDVIDERDTEENSIEEQSKSFSLLKEMSSEQLISLIMEMVDFKPELGTLVQTATAGHKPETRMAEKLKIVDDLLDTILEELQGFEAHKAERLGYFDIPDYPDELLQNVFSLLYESLREGKYQEVIGLTSVVLSRFAEACYDGIDSDGELVTVYAEAFVFIEKICDLDELSDTLREEFIQDLLKLSSEIACFDQLDWEFDLIEQAFHLCRRNAHTELVAEFIEKQLDGERALNFPSGNHRIERQLMLLYNIYIHNRKKEFVDAFLSEYINFPIIRKLAIDRLMDEMRLDDAEGLALDGQHQAKEMLSSGLEYDFMLKRCCIYEIAGEKEKMREILRDLILTFGVIDLYDRYKSTFSPQQWPAAASELIMKYAELKALKPELFRRESYACMLISEQQYEHLYELVAAHPEMVLDYDELLLSDYAGGVYSIYTTLIMKEATLASKRTEYHRVCELIARLKSIDGEQEAEACKSKIRELYSRKSAFMDELENV